MKKYFIILLVIFSYCQLQAQTSYKISKTLEWVDEIVEHNPTGNNPISILKFNGAAFNTIHPSLPLFMERFPINSNSKFTVQVINTEFENVEADHIEGLDHVAENLNFNVVSEIDRTSYYGKIFFIPFIKEGSQLKRLVNFEIEINIEANLILRPRGPQFTNVSELNSGDIYQISIEDYGVYKLDYNFLKNDLGIQNLDNIDPRNIKILGNGNGPIAEKIEDFEDDDLVETRIYIEGEGDGSFDAADYILFYGKGPNPLTFSAANQRFDILQNPYSRTNNYFIKIADSNGKRIGDAASVNNTVYQTNSFDAVQKMEADLINLLGDDPSNLGSGQNWYGDEFTNIREKDYSNQFDFTGILNGEEIQIYAKLAGRSNRSQSYTVEVNGQIARANIGGTNTGDPERPVAVIGTINDKFTNNQTSTSVIFKYPQTSETSTGWLDFIQVNFRKKLAMETRGLFFRDKNTLNQESTTYNISGADANTLVWEISDKENIKSQQGRLNGDIFSFGINGDPRRLHEFVAFKKNGSFINATAVGKVDNQNLHGIIGSDLVIIYHPDFETQATRLAEHRSNLDQITVNLVPIQQVFNEFSAGRLDPTAIRNFAKMLHDRTSKFRYLLLFGDGSYDYRRINPEISDDNFIPVYETEESLDPIDAFPTDDFYALLSDNEGGNLRGALDIAVGRIPVKTAEEAEVVVSKIINYDTNPNTFGDWRLRLAFVADDEDGNTHLRQADEITNLVDDDYQNYNVEKIYFDSYRQISTPGGERYPDANEALNSNIFKGLFMVNYIGHGGSSGWSQERVLRENDIKSWVNYDRLPLFITATCSFTGYDDPRVVTGGELALLNAEGGAIGLFTTVRAVYSSSNERLADSVFDRIFKKQGQDHPPMGEILRMSKNSNSSDTTGINARKFTCIGDPSMRLAFPRFNVVTTKIREKEVTENFTDTLRALDRVTIEGFIADFNGRIKTDFNGKIFPTIYDKKIKLTTLANDGGSTRDFKLQKNIIFKGAASVNSGKFSFTFVVPRDIDYTFGQGKISYYATDEVDRDAGGYFSDIIIGGSNPNAINDDKGPLVELFINDENFVFGGLSDENPTLLVKLSDDNGINVAGNSIGHDLDGVLDDDSRNSFILNDFYEAELDDYTKGSVEYPLFNLEEGRHTIKVKAWDVANNSGEGYTEFIVAKSGEVALEHVLNYPNPFTSNTNFQFEHNLSNVDMDISVQIFTIAGKIVKTINESINSQGFRVSDINWDGKDDFGDQLAKGTYLYKIKIRANSDISAESEFERLVILK